MELTFNKVGKQYEAEFQLSADANLHIEFESAAPVKLYQRTIGSGWDLVSDVKNAVGKATDMDLTSLIYPKFVKVVCVQEPTYATITTDGEITEIKSQSKEIEVTANGTMDITPDAGFAYLNSVKVKTNVAQSGEGGASYRFYSIKNLESKVVAIEYIMPSFARVNGMILPAALAYAGNMWESVSAVSVDASANVFMSGEWRNIGEILDGAYSFLQGIGIVEITEEEFYTL